MKPKSRRPQNSDLNKGPIIPTRPQCMLCPWRGADLGAHFIDKHEMKPPEAHKHEMKPPEAEPMFDLREYKR